MAIISIKQFNYAPVFQLAEKVDLKSIQCRFESDQGHFNATKTRKGLIMDTTLGYSVHRNKLN